MIGIAVAAVVIGGVFLFVLPRIADYRDSRLPGSTGCTVMGPVYPAFRFFQSR